MVKREVKRSTKTGVSETINQLFNNSIMKKNVLKFVAAAMIIATFTLAGCQTESSIGNEAIAEAKAREIASRMMDSLATVPERTISIIRVRPDGSVRAMSFNVAATSWLETEKARTRSGEGRWIFAGQACDDLTAAMIFRNIAVYYGDKPFQTRIVNICSNPSCTPDRRCASCLWMWCRRIYHSVYVSGDPACPPGEVPKCPFPYRSSRISLRLF